MLPSNLLYFVLDQLLQIKVSSGCLPACHKCYAQRYRLGLTVEGKMGTFMHLVLFADVLTHTPSDTRACPELRPCQVHAVPAWQQIKLEQSSTPRSLGLLSINPASSTQGIVLRPSKGKEGGRLRCHHPASLYRL